MDFCLQALVCVNSKQTKMPERVHFSSLRPKEKKKEKGKKMTKIQPETHPDLNLLPPVSFPLKPVSDCWLLISSTGGLED